MTAVILIFCAAALAAAIYLFWYSHASLTANRDVRAGVDTAEHYLNARFGPVPEWDPVNNMEHARITRDLQGADLEEYEDRLRRIEDEQTLHESSFSLTLKLAGCFVAEVLGCTLLFRSLGFSGIERIVPAVLFASFLFWITGETKRQGTDLGKRSRWFVLTIAAYALVMISVTVLRAMQAGTDNSSRAEELATGVVMLATTIGGAWLAEAIMSRRGPSVRLAKERRTVRRRFEAAKSRQTAAEKYSNRFARRREQVRIQHARAGAAYRAAHTRSTAGNTEEE